MIQKHTLTVISEIIDFVKLLAYTARGNSVEEYYESGVGISSHASVEDTV